MFAQTKGWVIPIDKYFLDANDPLYKNVAPGDTLYFLTGNRTYINLSNFQGKDGKPIVVVNKGGDVIIDTDNYYGISIQNCRYLKFTGTGYAGQFYGFKVKRVANGAGFSIGYLSSDIEVDHISIENTMIGGLYAKTDPDCDPKTARSSFTQYNTIIHDNYIAYTGDEGMYIGSTKYFGQTVSCNGKDTLIMPSVLDGVKVYNNILKYSGWDGIQVSSASKNCQIYDNSIENTMIGGLYAKTDPDCDPKTARSSFTQYNTIIHDNYIAYTGDEGMYIGSTKYFGQIVSCNGKDTLIMPSVLDGVKVYNNILKYSGWDGIQVSSASKNCQIYDNSIYYDSTNEDDTQMSGIMIGGGTKCDCYNNFIYHGAGDGIDCLGMGGTRIFNNIIVEPGLNFYANDPTKMKHGIFVNDVSIQKDSSFYLFNNDIIHPKSDGIRFSSVISKGNFISANIIINPGNFDYYENGNTSFKGQDSYIMFQSPNTNTTLSNNYLQRDAATAGFSSQKFEVPADFIPIAGSPLIDAVNYNVKTAISFDFFHHPRPNGLKSDIGAIEYDGVTSSNQLQFDPQNKQSWLVQNPVTDFLRIILPTLADPNLTVDIYDLNGTFLCEISPSKSSPGSSLAEMNVSALPGGVYIFSIRNGRTNYNGKFIKVSR